MVTAATILRHLLLGRKATTNLDSVLKSRDITLPTKVSIVKVIVSPVVMNRCESCTIKKAECWRIDELWYLRKESLGLQGDQIDPSYRKSTLNIHQKDWCWKSNTLATWCKVSTHWKRPWCGERLRVGAGDNRGWDGWMASLTQWTWVWASFGSWWWTRRSGVLRPMGSQRVRHNWATELKRAHTKGLLPGLFLPIPPSLWRAVVDPGLHRRPSNTNR